MGNQGPNPFTTELKRHVPRAELVGTWLSFVTLLRQMRQWEF
jgi:hypothetical protein